METLQDADGRRVITFMPYADKGWTSEADARLIAAAPELLEALKAHLAYCAQCPSGPTGTLGDCARCERDRALIRRIEGEPGKEEG